MFERANQLEDRSHSRCGPQFCRLDRMCDEWREGKCPSSCNTASRGQKWNGLLAHGEPRALREFVLIFVKNPGHDASM
jgi:hypothetical protein